ncbi:hypothetical protein NHX12_029129 [Muraenolepis orangiensis]|uniref:Uncharacterized protein n=1 Tax=Muraenolepis orangiensis TaxID=630683 RepID=A0A9Q0EDH2_9TELE|nr:hypothetical protein NHX12_029129 [Muraenolepis orangiensis]
MVTANTYLCRTRLPVCFWRVKQIRFPPGASHCTVVLRGYATVKQALARQGRDGIFTVSSVDVQRVVCKQALRSLSLAEPRWAEATSLLEKYVCAKATRLVGSMLEWAAPLAVDGEGEFEGEEEGRVLDPTWPLVTLVKMPIPPC